MRKMLSLASAVMLVLMFTVASGPATCATSGDVITVDILVSPQTILLGSDQGEMVTVHAEIPYSAVNESAALTLTLNGVPVQFTKADSRGELVAKFLEDEVKALFGDDAPPTVVLTLSGVTEDGDIFTGSDVVKIRYRK